MQRASSATNMIETEKMSENPVGARDIASTEELRLRAAWEKAWLREYQCHTRYLALVEMDEDEERDIQSAWLQWWDAACVCREAARLLECSEGLHTMSCTTGQTTSKSCEPRT
jgi:hypothetical protein